MNYDPKSFAEMQSKLHETQAQRQRRINREKKARQRQGIKAWCMEHYGVKDAEAVVMRLMKIGD